MNAVKLVSDEINLFHNDYPDMVVCANGDIIALIRECGPWSHRATFDFPTPLSFFEVEPKMVIYRSVDGGVSFKKENTVFDGFCFDAMIWKLADGRLMAGVVGGEYGLTKDRSKLKGVLHRHLPEMDTVITVDGLKVAFSSDNGHTWEGLTTISIDGWQNLYNLRKGIQAPDGTILVPFTVGYPWQTRHIGLLRSFDGESWGDVSTVAAEPLALSHYSSCPGYWEPSIASLSDGTLVCAMVLDDCSSAAQRAGKEKTRTGVYTDYLPKIMVSFSTDYGFTWSRPQFSGLNGDFPSFVRGCTGAVMLNYVSRYKDRSELHAARSVDAVSWDDKVLYAEDGCNFYCVNGVEFKGSYISAFMKAGSDKLRSTWLLKWH